MDNLTSFQLMKAERCVTRWFNRELAVTGLTLSQLYLLWAIRDNKGSCITEIAKEVGCDRSTITRNLRLLGGLVHEEVNTHSKNSKTISLSPSGSSRLEKSIKLIEKLDEKIGYQETSFKNRLITIATKFGKEERRKQTKGV